jgi:trimethylamine:corrinoid methyltransferase-like protein
MDQHRIRDYAQLLTRSTEAPDWFWDHDPHRAHQPLPAVHAGAHAARRDLYHRAANVFRDLELNDETLALDVIDAVGPDGHFLAQPHTRRHMRDAVEVARERALDILQHYEPEPLDDDARRELRRIVGDADRELRG